MCGCVYRCVCVCVCEYSLVCVVCVCGYDIESRALDFLSTRLRECVGVCVSVCVCVCVCVCSIHRVTGF